jgi:DNA invertase Pin-like site-specific DNA recombinase
MRQDTKITGSHLERVALVYVRQSTLTQVRDHTESTARQYALVDEAVRLGWPRARVEVIDADLGVSGASMQGRDGFRKLVARVCLGEVGAILGLEVSRLARSSADLSRLLEMARLTDTLVIDGDGIYDLADFNDRLLLGLKGTMSEAELHLLAGRLQGAKRAAAARGELRVPLPVGFVYDDDRKVIIDPDEEVAAAIRDLFAAFTQTGSAYGVVGVFAGRRFPKRAYGGAWAGQLRWGPLNHSRVLGVLSNPCYAGAYVFGRHRTRRMIDPDGTVRTRTQELPPEEWEIVIRDHHPGYIDFATFETNQARLAANRTNAGERPPREGVALCQGIIVCGSCGRAMSTRYRGNHGYYECAHSRADRTTTATCRSVRADVVDGAVAERLLAALEPDQVALALAAADEVADRRARSIRAAELAVERARYHADRAERALDAVEPENRLVARTLEARFETKLAALAEAEAALAAARADVGPAPPREQLETLAADLPSLWAADTTSDRDRKRLLRTLVADVTLLPEPDRTKVRVGIRWHSGAADELTLQRPRPAPERRATDPAAVALARQLGPTMTNAELAGALNAAGHTTGTGKPFDRVAAGNLRYAHRIPSPGLLEPGELTVSGVAARLGVTTGTVHHWITRGWLPARRCHDGRYAITFSDQVEADCRARIAASRHLPRQNPDAPARRDHELSVNQVADRLQISTNVVYYWLRRGYLDARRDPTGNWCIPLPAEVEAACRQSVAASSRIVPKPNND